MTTTAVIFDLWGTLVPVFTGDEYASMLGELAEAVGVDHGTFTDAWAMGYLRRNLGGTTADAIRMTCALIKHEPREADIAAAVRARSAFTRRFLLAPRVDAVPTLAALRARGLRLGLISDCTAEVPAVWPETPVAELISEAVFSCEVGCKKPDPAIYSVACERLGVEPGECLYVGDGGSDELNGARAMGMRAVQLVPPEDQPEALRVGLTRWEGEKIDSLGILPSLLT